MRILLSIAFLLGYIVAYTQPKSGIIFQVEYNRVNVKGAGNYLSENNFTQKPYMGGKLGVVIQQNIYKKLNLESQLGVYLRGVSYKRNIDLLVMKNRGSYNLLGLEIPIILTYDFPSESYSTKFYIGAGALLNATLTGIIKQNEIGKDYLKAKINIGNNDMNKFSFLDYGLTGLLGFEDSDNQNIRLGFNYYIHGIYNYSSHSIRNNQLFLSYIKFF